MPAAKAFAGSAILNELSRTHIHTTYMYIYAGLVHIFLYIYIQQVEESACNTLQHTCNKCVLYELPLFHRESSVMDAYTKRHHCS